MPPVDEIARVQISTDGGDTWQDIFTQAGDNSMADAYTTNVLSLSEFAGKIAVLRFNYDLSAANTYGGSGQNVGWFLEGIAVTNTQKLVNLATNATASTNFTFTPAQAGNYVLQARRRHFQRFSAGFGDREASDGDHRPDGHHVEFAGFLAAR